MATTTTTSQVDRLAAQQALTFKQMEQMVDAAKRENRSFTSDEEKKFAALTEQHAAYDKRIAEAQSDVAFNTKLGPFNGGTAKQPSGLVGVRGGWGEALAYDPDFREFIRAGGHRRSGPWSQGIELQATTLTEGVGSGGALVATDFRPEPVPLGMPPIVIANLFAQGQTASNAVSYVKEKSFTNNAAATTETALKPESALVYEPASAPVCKYAHWIPASTELLEDARATASTINTKLRQGSS